MYRPPPRYGVSTSAVLCSGRSPQPSGSGYRGSVVSPPAGGDHSAACMGLPVAGLVRDAPPRGASPMLFPRPESQAVFLDAFRIPWGNLSLYAFPPFLSSDGWWLKLERPQSLHDSGRPHLAGEGVVCRTSHSLLVGFPVRLRRGKGLSVLPVTGSQSSLNSVFGLQGLVRGASREICYVPSKFFKTVKPEEFSPPILVIG